MKFVLPLSLAFSLAVACTGEIGKSQSGGGGTSTPTPEAKTNPSVDPGSVLNSSACQQINPGASPLRRLSNAEYQNTISDLFGMGTSQVQQVVDGFVAESESLGFRNGAEFLAVSSLVAEQFMGAAEKLAKAAATNTGFTRCSDGNHKACGSKFVRDFGLRAYRRPLTTEEAERLDGLFQSALSTYDFSTAVEWTVYAMLQSPNFLFRVESNAISAKGKYAPATGYEMASRLSFLLWQSMPDEDLFAAAEQGKLETSAQVAAQAERMLADPKSERTLEFFRQWMDTDGVKQFSRDEKVFSNLPNNLHGLFRQENDAFVRELVLTGNGGFKDLVSASYTFANKELAQHYGLEGDFGSEFQRVERPAAAGFLTQGGFLTAHDKATRTSIVLRGVKVRTDVMCEVIPAPPNNVELNLDAIGEGLSQQERLALHRTDPACAGCHKLIDPIGVAFESFDAVGRQRAMDETGKAIDTQTEISGSFDLDGPLADAQAMGRAFAASNQARQCYLDQNFRFFYGRDYTDADTCSRAKLAKAFADSNYNLKDVLLALTQTDAFLYRSVAQ